MENQKSKRSSRKVLKAGSKKGSKNSFASNAFGSNMKLDEGAIMAQVNKFWMQQENQNDPIESIKENESQISNKTPSPKRRSKQIVV